MMRVRRTSCPIAPAGLLRGCLKKRLAPVPSGGCLPAGARAWVVGPTSVSFAIKWLAFSKVLPMVPGERIELPTNGLQNRCSTAELTRRPCFQ